jgi:nitroimidazol reductase NimA-like FMN-containing flavoprotein (pyridoxamine 5'-phosphate oxidase superfamily)
MIGYLNREQCETVLMENLLGYIGCNDGFSTYIYPVNYLYDGRFIVCHSAIGSKIQVMRCNRRVCFQAGGIKISKTGMK